MNEKLSLFKNNDSGVQNDLITMQNKQRRFKRGTRDPVAEARK